jgi:hypothetical protein
LHLNGVVHFRPGESVVAIFGLGGQGNAPWHRA